MFLLYANKNRLAVRQTETLTSGSVNVYRARFQFSADWNGLTRTAVFKAGDVVVNVLLDESGECVIPHEVLKKPRLELMAGVYGTDGGTVVLPTVWASLRTILEGVKPGEEAQPPTPDLWEQELARKADRMDYTDDGELGLYAGDKLLSAVQVKGGSGGPAYKFGHGLKQEGLTVSVNAVDDFTGDNTLPMTAAGVYATVGNIEALLETI